MEKVNEVLRQEIKELQEEAQSTLEVLNKAEKKLQECKAPLKELKSLKAVQLKLEGTVKEMENKYAEELKIGKARISEKKELEQKILEQQKKIDSLKVFEQTCKDKESVNVTLRERIQLYANQQTKFHAQNKVRVVHGLSR